MFHLFISLETVISLASISVWLEIAKSF